MDFPDGCRLDFDLNTHFRDGRADVIPTPHQPTLLKMPVQGCKVIDGLGMLVNQGVIGIKHWTGVTRLTVMRAALEEVFS